ncbi:hypothetical protein [Rhodopirellula sp. P2]|uniref:hypothetical protein n=1 Tax=Rhodopirellula sp. P2 TaxID=2127060 RepID=UPI0023685186|nr:hypothetical protein [Rhodopirellula sp. P2]WDQ18145.1 hypothetical protein PSR62_06215 [Rhodopirellula sp. P2]
MNGMRMFGVWAAILFSVVTAPSVNADPIVQRQTDGPMEFSLRVSDSETLVAEPLQVELEVIVPGDLQVVLPDFMDSLGDWEIVAKEIREDLPHASAAGTDSRRWWVRLTLESLQTGEVKIPSVEVQTLPRQSENQSDEIGIDWEKAGSLATQPIAIHMRSVLSESADPMKPEPIAEMISLPTQTTPSSSWMPTVVVGLVGVLIAGAVVLFRMRSRGGISDAVWARRRLADLRTQWQKQKLTPDECSRQLSGIFRDRIGSMMGRESTVTSEDALACLQESEPAVSENLRAMLTRADEVAFAGISANSAEVDAWLDVANDWMGQLDTLQTRLSQEATA